MSAITPLPQSVGLFRAHEWMQPSSMPRLGLGTWKSDPGLVGTSVEQAISLGYRHIDCAAIYGNEAEIGQALNRCFSEGKIRREELFITSKLWNTNHHPSKVREALEKTLHDLQLEYLDLYLIHWPFAFGPEGPHDIDHLENFERVPLHVTWKAMEELVKSGKVKRIGVSNFSVQLLHDMMTYAEIPPAVNQVELHPYLPQDDLVRYCHARRIVMTAYSPLGSSDFSLLLTNPVLLSIGERLGKTAAQVALRWAVQRWGGQLTVIPKTVRPARMTENLSVLTTTEWTLSEDDMQAIAALPLCRFIDSNLFLKFNAFA